MSLPKTERNIEFSMSYDSSARTYDVDDEVVLSIRVPNSLQHTVNMKQAEQYQAIAGQCELGYVAVNSMMGV